MFVYSSVCPFKSELSLSVVLSSSTSSMQEVQKENNSLQLHNQEYKQSAAMTGEEYNEMEEQLQNR